MGLLNYIGTIVIKTTTYFCKELRQQYSDIFENIYSIYSAVRSLRRNDDVRRRKDEYSSDQ